MNNVTKEELNQLNSLKTTISELENRIADNEIRRAVAVNSLIKAKNELEELSNIFREKYGEVSINLKTGEYFTDGN
jgi:hypothetical protein